MVIVEGHKDKTNNRKEEQHWHKETQKKSVTSNISYTISVLTGLPKNYRDDKNPEWDEITLANKGGDFQQESKNSDCHLKV